jgi:hypothetical protein
MRPGRCRLLVLGSPDAVAGGNASVQAKVDHPFRVITQQFGHHAVPGGGQEQGIAHDPVRPLQSLDGKARALLAG